MNHCGTQRCPVPELDKENDRLRKEVEMLRQRPNIEKDEKRPCRLEMLPGDTIDAKMTIAGYNKACEEWGVYHDNVVAKLEDDAWRAKVYYEDAIEELREKLEVEEREHHITQCEAEKAHDKLKIARQGLEMLLVKFEGVAGI